MKLTTTMIALLAKKIEHRLIVSIEDTQRRPHAARLRAGEIL